MTADGFRRLALALPGAEERAHMHHPDFRVAKKIFATLGYPDASWAMVKLTPEQQFNVIRADSETFLPVKGAWGRQGCTNVHLASATAASLRPALKMAWENAQSAKPVQRANAARPRPGRTRPL